MSIIAESESRVRESTPSEVQEHLDRQTDARVARYVTAGRECLNERLSELDAEWDIERTLELNAASLSLVGFALGTLAGRRWHLLSAVVGFFLVQHAIQGWCPPLPVLRRLGFRTAEEIRHERTALKILRGDFRGVTADDRPPSANVAAIMEAVRRR